MKLRLLYKSYAARGMELKQGDVLDLPDSEAERFLKTYPDWFSPVSETHMAGKDKPEEEHGNLGGGGPHKETKPVKGHITK